ncbi:MAG TPA: NAD(+) synthase [Methanomassiliicoccales archaeon]|nr:NAD(+) synthase [Methanomassiliicoccales archaeon]
MKFRREALDLDCDREIERICSFIKQQTTSMKREGVVVGLSGGIDSALSSSLCVEALGKESVLGLILPEKESNPISAQYAKKHARRLGIKILEIDITPVLEGFGTYEKRDAIIRKMVPDYEPDSRIKITLPGNLLARDAYNFFTLNIMRRNGEVSSCRLNKATLNGIVAATDTKQRTRMMQLYYYAEMNNYLVCGTTNRSEQMQGFFVKYGDGGVDIEPIAHLYKTQVYQISRRLGVMKEILDRVPSPDTFSYEVSDEEFYFRMPYDVLDLLLYAWENKIGIPEVCEALDLEEQQVARAFREIANKHNSTKHLRESPPNLLEA